MGYPTFNKKIKGYINEPKKGYVLYVPGDSKERFLIGQEGGRDAAICFKFYLLVEEKTGNVLQISYQLFAPPLAIAICEVICELAEEKNYVQLSRIGADLIEKALKERPHQELPKEFATLVNLALSALYMATDQCQDIVIDGLSYHSPLFGDLSEEQNHEKMWDEYSFEKKLAIINHVIKEDIEPYVALDQGGVEVKDFVDDREVVIGYKGSCTTCFSATGATLNAINQILKQKVHSKLVVKPDITTLKF